MAQSGAEWRQRRWGALGGLMITLGLTPIGGGAIAQPITTCEPPDVGEYLLLIDGDPETLQPQLQQALPPSLDLTSCTYLGKTITRVGGFTDVEVANFWAQYVTDLGNGQVVVAHPPSEPVEEAGDAAAEDETPEADRPEHAIAPPTAATEPTSEPPALAPSLEETPDLAEPQTSDAVTSPTAAEFPQPEFPTPAFPPSEWMPGMPLPYNPQALGEGYAVLVQFFDQPAIAAQLQQQIGRNVGVVAYEQSPYLLAVYTSDPIVATTLLQYLSHQDFSVVVVDSQDVVLLTPTASILGQP